MHMWFSLLVLDLTVVFAMLGVEPRASGLLDTPEIPVFMKFIFSIKVLKFSWILIYKTTLTTLLRKILKYNFY